MAGHQRFISAVDSYDLARFVEAQERDYVQALSEIRSGQKRSHWMWYIFPQFDGLGFSSTSRRYSIKSVAEAEAYLAASHPRSAAVGECPGDTGCRGPVGVGDIRLTRRHETAVVCDAVRQCLTGRICVWTITRPVLRRRARRQDAAIAGKTCLTARGADGVEPLCHNPGQMIG